MIRPRWYRDSAPSPDSSLTASDPALRAEFDAAHERYRAGIERFFRRRLPRRDEHAAELVQQTWTAVWKSLSQRRYDPGRGMLSTYIYAVAYKIWLQDLRRSGGAPAGDTIDAVADELLAGDDAADVAIHAADLLEALRGCRESVLSDDERAVVDAGAAGLSDRDAAQLLGIAASTVHERRRRAFAKLRACLEQKGFSEIEPERRTPGGE